MSKSRRCNVTGCMFIADSQTELKQHKHMIHAH